MYDAIERTTAAHDVDDAQMPIGGPTLWSHRGACARGRMAPARPPPPSAALAHHLRPSRFQSGVLFGVAVPVAVGRSAGRVTRLSDLRRRRAAGV